MIAQRIQQRCPHSGGKNMFGPEKCLSVRLGSFDLWGQRTPKEHISEQYIDAIMEVAGSIRYNTETLGTAR